MNYFRAVFLQAGGAMLDRGTTLSGSWVWPGFLTRSVVFFLLLKCCYILLGIVWGTGNDWLQVFHRNDSSWYALIVENGYPTAPPLPGIQSAFAFFPLYPSLIKLFMPLFESFHQAAFAVSLLTGLLWIALCFRMLRQLAWADREIFRFLLLFQLIPFHHFHHVFYTEQLFLLLLAGVMYHLEQRNITQLFILSMLLALTRPTGLIYAATLPLLYLPDYKHPAVMSWIRRCWPLLGAPFGMLLWMGYQKLHCGDALAFSHAQSSWNRSYTWPWTGLFNQGTAAISVISCYAIITLAAATIFFRRSGPGIILFQLLNLLFPLSTGQVMSYPRYVSVNLPFLLNLRRLLNKRFFALATALAAILHLGIFYTWVANLPIWSY